MKKNRRYTLSQLERIFKDYKERYNVENCFELLKMFNIKTKTDEKGLYFIIED